MSAGTARLLAQDSGDETVDGFEYEEVYRVITTSADDGGNVVLTADGLPFMGQGFYGDGLSIVTSRRPEQQTDSLTHWLVRVRYTRQKGSDQDKQTPPTLRPTKRSASTRWVERALMMDEDENPILTTAKSPFNPPITVSVPHPVVRFQRWEASFTTATKKTYEGKTNSSTFGAYDAGWVLCSAIEASEEWEQDGAGNVQKYWLVTYEFEACYDATDKWRPLKILNVDYFGLDPTDSFKRKPLFIDKDGDYTFDPDDANGATPVPQPVAIDSSGVYIPASGLPTGAHYLEFNTIGEVDFNALGLPVD